MPKDQYLGLRPSAGKWEPLHGYCYIICWVDWHSGLWNSLPRWLKLISIKKPFPSVKDMFQQIDVEQEMWYCHMSGVYMACSSTCRFMLRVKHIAQEETVIQPKWRTSVPWKRNAIITLMPFHYSATSQVILRCPFAIYAKIASLNLSDYAFRN